ncbi:DUF6054 family protein [Clostridium fungisolvens]|uniref:DUF1499 domain-containing protein n=1 Tax=Clostridium fungisolvens TaxID=1604897 RepID=A0A6V8SNA5_9CLOT|nr:DUF6054 family protein [Clostridium fungisolvens]GFP78196.1 hypothetical protein bsdtw1_04390 [Clostridium fungisolvens]
MSKYNFKVNITPNKAFSLVKNSQSADLVHEEFFELENGVCTGTLVYEKYYMRTSNRAALVVIIDNIKGYTDVRAIATGSSEGWLFKFDWGAADNFAASIEKILKEYII